MIVRVALVAMHSAMAVSMIVMVVAVMVMIMPAAAALAMGMMVLVRMIVMAVMVFMTVIVVIMIMVVVVVVMATAAIIAMGVVMHLRLRLERALDRRHRAALPAHQLGQRRIVRNIERLGRHFGRDVMAAEMPGEARQPQRILGSNLQQAFRHGLDLHETAVLQLEGIAVVQHRRLVERDLDLEPARGRCGHATTIAVAMGETERVGNALGANGGLAKDGSGAKHLRRSHGWGSGQRLRARIAA